MKYLQIDPLSLRNVSLFKNCLQILGPRRIIVVFEPCLLKGHITTILQSCRLFVPLLPLLFDYIQKLYLG